MANSHKGEVDLIVGEQSYRLKLGTASAIEFQEMFSTPEEPADIDQLMLHLRRGRLKYVVAYLCAAMQKFHPGTTTNDVEELLDTARPEDIQNVLQQLGVSMTPAQEDLAELAKGVKANPRKARASRGTGGSSSSRRAAQA